MEIREEFVTYMLDLPQYQVKVFLLMLRLNENKVNDPHFENSGALLDLSFKKVLNSYKKFAKDGCIDLDLEKHTFSLREDYQP